MLTPLAIFRLTRVLIKLLICRLSIDHQNVCNMWVCGSWIQVSTDTMTDVWGSWRMAWSVHAGKAHELWVRDGSSHTWLRSSSAGLVRLDNKHRTMSTLFNPAAKVRGVSSFCQHTQCSGTLHEFWLFRESLSTLKYERRGVYAHSALFDLARIHREIMPSCGDKFFHCLCV